MLAHLVDSAHLVHIGYGGVACASLTPLRRHAAAHRPPVGQPPARASLITTARAMHPKVHRATAAAVWRARKARSCGTEGEVAGFIPVWGPVWTKYSFSPDSPPSKRGA